MTAEAGARQRIDKWLFFARVVKSRSLAAKLAVGGKVRVNRDKIEQAAHQVKVGDVLTITLDRRILVYKIVAPGERRGPAPEAQFLYEDLSPPPASATAMAAEVVTPQRESGAGRPTKKERRETDRLRGN
ncbi:RNA-binding S4 domain-containing protein [Brucella tritici]|uniref:RNA-binding S4 domain-containing protein n=1 Tax=Brucella tritici TaxID=94626 RepID=A0A6L3YJP2_9HYPH|nr:RNA-binding S4 domain-containing protein [Brucella tritici]KAB2676410.1 RNA-binding S4 domain-containing protein [Brucella tritici]KAB2683206.1 RNA-binding S4 domain-containing protein [Brucella tritici]